MLLEKYLIATYKYLSALLLNLEFCTSSLFTNNCQLLLVKETGAIAEKTA